MCQDDDILRAVTLYSMNLFSNLCEYASCSCRGSLGYELTRRESLVRHSAVATGLCPAFPERPDRDYCDWCLLGAYHCPVVTRPNTSQVLIAGAIVYFSHKYPPGTRIAASDIDSVEGPEEDPKEKDKAAGETLPSLAREFGPGP
jgi:hypothetical protein